MISSDRSAQLVHHLPSPLAIVVHEYLAEEGEYVRLHRMCAALEILCRFLTAIAMADLRRLLADEPFPESLITNLAQQLERPTLASWRVLLESVTSALDKAGSPAMPELLEFATKIVRRMGAGRDDPLLRLLPMRNELAHGGRLSEHRVRELLAAHRDSFESLLDELHFLTKTRFIAVQSPRQGLWLHGVPRNEEFQTVDLGSLEYAVPARFPRLLLQTPAATLDLCPLHWYGDLLRSVDERLESVGEAAIQLYSRRLDSGAIELTALGSRSSVSRASAELDQEFEQLFPIGTWQSHKRLAGDLSEFDFSERIRSLTSLFVGRDQQLAQAASEIDSLGEGIVWIGGKPGMGKSAFVAKLVRDHFWERTDVVTIPYFFVASESSRCRMDAFLKAAVLHLLAATGSTGRPAPADQRLPQLHALADSAFRTTGRKTILFLDALDEVAVVDSSWANVIFDRRLPHVVWVCAGRDEPHLTEEFRRERCHWLFPAGGLLPPLSSDDVRGLFIEDLGHRLPQLFHRDRPQSNAKGLNSFVETVLARSQGLPLYLRLLVDQLRSGKVDFGPASETKLPAGLVEYYDSLLDHPDLKSALWAVLALLSQAKEALSFEVLRDALREHDLLRQSQGAQCLRDALRLGHVMLKQVALADGQAAYELYHHSFRQHLNSSERFCLHTQAAKEWLVDYCWWQYQQGPGAMTYYARAHLPAHLYEMGRKENLHQAVVDSRLNYIEEWIQEGRFSEAARCLKEVVGLLHGQRGREAELAVLTTALARICTRRGRYESARRWLKQALVRTSWITGRRARAIALHELGTLSLYANDYSAAKKHYRSALWLSRWGIPGLGEPAEFTDEVSANLVALATVEHQRHRYKQAIVLADRARRAALRAGDLRHRVAAESLRAASLRSLMRLAEADQQFRLTESECRQHGFALQLGNLLLMRAWMEYSIATIERRVPSESSASFEEANNEHQRAGYVYGLLESRLAVAWCALACRDIERASAIYQETQALLPQDHHPSLRLDHELGLVAMIHSAGELSQALPRYGALARQSLSHKKERVASQARVGEGACLWHLGQPQPAENAWNAARDLALRVSVLDHEVIRASIEMCRNNRTMPPR